MVVSFDPFNIDKQVFFTSPNFDIAPTKEEKGQKEIAIE